MWCTGSTPSSFRIKIDAVPSRTNSTWFQATKVGSYDIQCTVICGVDHSLMLSKVIVVPEDEFKAWYFGGEDAPELARASAPRKPTPTSRTSPGPRRADRQGLPRLPLRGWQAQRSAPP